MVDAWKIVGNSSSSHHHGRETLRLVEQSREIIAQYFDCLPSEVLFTSGGTESDNLAIRGLFLSRLAVEPEANVIALSALEHPAVAEAAQALAEEGLCEVVTLPSRGNGVVDLKAAEKALSKIGDRLSLVSVMWVNNELGTIQPISEISHLAREHGALFHSDAVQAAGYLPISLSSNTLNAVSVTAHKFGGPQGIGALILKRGTSLHPQIYGGGQERGLRSGTLPVALIAGFAGAVSEVATGGLRAASHTAKLRDLIEDVAEDVYPAVRINGKTVKRIPGTTSLTFPGLDSTALLINLDAASVSCSAGSACAAGSSKPSPSLKAIGMSPELQQSTLRVSVGWQSTDADVEAFREALQSAVAVSQPLT